MNLADARSYFSAGHGDNSFELRLQEPGELERQLLAHADEADYIKAAIVELYDFGRMLATARRLSPAAKTQAGTYFLELLWNVRGELLWNSVGDGSTEYGELIETVRRRHNVGLYRNARVFWRLRDDRVVTVAAGRAELAERVLEELHA